MTKLDYPDVWHPRWAVVFLLRHWLAQPKRRFSREYDQRRQRKGSWVT